MEEIAKNHPYVVMFTHASYIDGFLNLRYQKLCGAWVAPMKAELFKIPFFGALLRACNILPLRRKNHAESVKSINELAVYCKRENFSLAISPEGKRRRKPSVDNCEDNFLTFKKGPFHVACDNNFPIMLVLVVGNNRIWPPS